MPPQTVDEFVKTKIRPEQQAIVAMLRDLMRECAPNAEESIAYGSPVWEGKQILAVMSPSKTHITFAFSRGAEFTDKYRLLTGVGKQTRHVKIKKVADVNKDASLLIKSARWLQTPLKR